MTNKLQMLANRMQILLYMVFVFISVLSLSSWNLFHGNTIYIGTTLISVMLLLLFIFSFISNWTLSRFFWVFIILGIISVYFYLYKYSYFLTILLAIVIGSSMQFEKIIKADLIARSFSIIFVIILSILSILPKSGIGISVSNFHFTRFTYGFTYPNVLGYLLVVVIVDLIILYHFEKRVVLSAGLLGFVLETSLSYGTGMSCVALILLLFFILNKHGKRIISFGIATGGILVFLLTILSTFIAKNFNSTNALWNKVNDILSLRPPIWQYYFKAMPINLFGTERTINQETFGVVGFGAFDGAYIQFLLEFGIISIIIIGILFLAIAFHNGTFQLKKAILFYIVVTCASGFVETNGFLITFTPMFFLIGSILLNSDNVIEGKTTSISNGLLSKKFA